MVFITHCAYTLKKVIDALYTDLVKKEKKKQNTNKTQTRKEEDL